MENTNNQNESTNLSTLHIPRMLPLKEVIYFTGLSRTTIYDMLDKKSNRYDTAFPRQVKLSRGRVAWVESEIVQWLNTKIADRCH
ncbi:AlpA family phage regulatory protein [Psychrobacter frigidicola]|uniref:AlpA family phage regulatory protein n=1 Tax=Psychrobacter frigidicola TaxID=45611 RepID=A0A5C7A0M1_9GAMM|nr:AlpA family phage regulatory protein [Psychrobacter frigidicola]TXD96211.1 AlpA family phage regulatory protein [Psychrobacter frigidicola]